MVTDASEHESDDKARREQVERRNKLDNLCYTVEKTLREQEAKLPAADVSLLRGLVQEGKGAVEKQDDTLITSLFERIESESHRIASAVYQGAEASPNANRSEPNGAGAGAKGVVDAEFEDSPPA